MDGIDRRIGLVLLVFQCVMIIAFAFLTSYATNSNDDTNKAKERDMVKYYPMFQDVQVMILIGFGMLMTFLKKYSHSGVGLNFLLSATTFQYAILCSRISGPVNIGIDTLVEADILTAAVLISMGGVLGKVSPLQLLVMSIIEAPLYFGNKFLIDKLQVVDVGGSILVHTFGTYFGLSTSKFLGKPKNTDLEDASYQSNIFSIIGTLFLWVFWPSFNGVLSQTHEGQSRAAINTYLALLGSCVTAFALSSLTHKKHKFTMAHIQNATLAGGVAIGTAADLMVLPWGALLVGSIAGSISTLGFAYLQPWLLRRFGLHDSCGINNLHGMTSILAGIIGAIVSAKASKEIYGKEFDILFPAMGPNGLEDGFLVNINRSASIQSAYQILALVLTFVISIVGGTLTGILLKFSEQSLGKVLEEYTFDDQLLWDVEEKEEILEKREGASVLETFTRSINHGINNI